jgi:serine/threonine protein kinase/tetratricopeptide (TPR) repeat protein
VQEIVGQVLDSPPEERETIQNRECGEDASLRAEVEKLLAAAAQADAKGFLFDADPLIGTSIGPYRIQRCLGQGGMGAVYLAEQIQPIHRTVALKIIKLGMDTRQVIARFETEREALALMNHPNVARVFDAGATETGRPYFAMEYVAGIPITEYCDKHRLNTEERLRLFMDVCHAVQHAHQKGIIHRDIKPSNVLVSVQDDKPVVKVIDFGVAKATQHRLTERTLFTEQGQLIGTPGYMSPEQAEMTALDIDTRTDVYSLGVLLYELLVGAMPFDTKTLLQRGFAEIQRIIREVDPSKPSTKLSSIASETVAAATGSTGMGSGTRSRIDEIARCRHTELKTLLRQLRGDLDWIVMRCLEKDRTRRYDTANALSLEIERHLRNEPVFAGPPSAAYRVDKFVRRNKGAVAAVAVVMLALATGLSVAVGMYLRAERAHAETAAERDRAVEAERAGDQAREEAEQVTKFLTDMLAAADPRKQGKDVTVRQVLDRAAETIGEKFTDNPLLTSRLRQTVGETYLQLGFYEQAESHLADAAATYRKTVGEEDSRALGAASGWAYAMALRGGRFSASESLLRRTLEIQHSVLGWEHADTLRSMYALANVLRWQGRYAEAEEMHRKTLEIRRRVLGEECPDTLFSMANLGASLLVLGRHTEAEEMHRKTLEIRQRVLGEEHPDTLYSMTDLAIVLANQGRYAEAEEMHRKTLEIRQRVLGEEHPDTLYSMTDLAIVLANQGRYAEAEEMHRKTLEIRRRVLGEEHPDTLWSMNKLADVLLHQGRYAEAEELARKTLGIRRRVLGEEHPDTLWCMNNLADVLLHQGRYAEAEEPARKTLEIQRRVLGEENPGTLRSMYYVAVLFTKQGRYPEAEELYRKALEIQRHAQGEEHPNTLLWMNNLGDLLRIEGRYSEADELHRKTLEIQRRVLSEEHPNTLMSMLNLALVFANQGRYPEAEELARKTLGIQRRVLSEENPDTLVSMVTLAEVLLHQSQYAEAEALAREALTISENKGEANDAERWLTTSIRGGALTGLGRLAEAESLLVIAYEGLKDRGDVPPADKRRALERIVRLYDSWDAAAPGKGYAEKAAEWQAKLEKLKMPEETQLSTP